MIMLGQIPGYSQRIYPTCLVPVECMLSSTRVPKLAVMVILGRKPGYFQRIYPAYTRVPKLVAIIILWVEIRAPPEYT